MITEDEMQAWRNCDHDWAWEHARMLCTKCGWERPADNTMEYAQERITELETLLAERDRMLMVLFMEERDEASERGKDFFMPSDLWLADLKARAEEGGGDET